MVFGKIRICHIRVSEISKEMGRGEEKTKTRISIYMLDNVLWNLSPIKCGHREASKRPLGPP